MGAFDSATGWGWVTRLLHWTMAALILFQLGFGFVMVRVEDLLERFALTQTHKSWGFVIFLLALARLLWRLGNRERPAAPPGMPGWQARGAGIVVVLLYGLMMLMPVAGWVLASASTTQNMLQIQNLVFGTYALPDPFVPGSERIEAAARLVHASGALALAVLLALHAGAALRHHFVKRDAVLRRMVSGR